MCASNSSITAFLSILSAIIGGLITGYFTLQAVKTSIKLQRQTEDEKDLEETKDKLRVFIAELNTNREIAKRKAEVLEEILPLLHNIPNDYTHFENAHATTQAFNALRAELVFAYGIGLYGEIQSVYDELTRLDGKIDQFDNRFLGEDWRTSTTIYGWSSSLLRKSIPHYREQMKRLDGILDQLSKES